MTEKIPKTPFDPFSYFSPMIFCDEKRKEEWENIDPNLKTLIETMEAKMAIEMLCDIISDLILRVEKLEKNEKSS